MPLYIDFHKAVNATVEELKMAHLAYKAVQQKYGVTYHQFWVNEEEGTVFCLVEAPDKETCEAIHQEADGLMTCSIVEVEAGMYELFMRRDHMEEKRQTRKFNEHADPSIRLVLVTDFRKITAGGGIGRDASQKSEYTLKDLTLSILARFNGREVNWLPDGSIVSVFDSPLNTLQCALQIQAELRNHEDSRAECFFNAGFRMGLSAEQPLPGTNDFFSGAIKHACRLCRVARAGELLISAKMQECCDVKEVARQVFPEAELRLLTSREEAFMSRMYSISEEQLAEENFTVDHLCRNIGMSRPQLYRKTVLLTGKSPNDFIRDLRMEKALTLIRKKAGNIAEIALEVGYNNPSYFARCFQLRYGCAPSRFVE